MSITGFRVKDDGCAGQSFIRSYATFTGSTDNTDDVVDLLRRDEGSVISRKRLSVPSHTAERAPKDMLNRLAIAAATCLVLGAEIPDRRSRPARPGPIPAPGAAEVVPAANTAPVAEPAAAPADNGDLGFERPR